MSEQTDAALRRQYMLRMMSLMLIGIGSCTGCHQRAEIFCKRRTTPGEAKERCLDCWRIER